MEMIIKQSAFNTVNKHTGKYIMSFYTSSLVYYFHMYQIMEFFLTRQSNSEHFLLFIYMLFFLFFIGRLDN